MARPALLLIVIAVIYGPTLGYRFVNYDDPVNLEHNPFFNPLTPSNVARVWTEPHINLYIPVTYTVWAGLAWLAWRGEKTDPATGEKSLVLEPSIFHGANVALFAASAVLVFLVLRRLLRKLLPETADERVEWGAFAGALLFVVHPLQVESVAWATSLKGTLAGFFALASLALYLAHWECAAGMAARARYAGALVLFVLALLSKPTSVVLPLWLAVLGDLVYRKRPASLLRELSPWLLLAVATSAVANRLYPPPAVTDPGFAGRLLVSLDTLGFYLAKLFWPATLAVEYDRLPETVLTDPWAPAIAAGVVASAAAIYAHYRRTREPWLAASALLFAISLLPVLGLKPHEMQHVTNASDRYMLLSLVGAGLALSWVVVRWGTRRPVAWSVVAVCCALMIKTALQCETWKDSFTLHAHTLSVKPASARALKNLAAAHDEAGDYEKAAIFYERAVALRPRAEDANRLGVVHLYRSDAGRALAAFQRAIDLERDNPGFHFNLSVALRLLGRTDEARKAYDDAAVLARRQNLPPLPPFDEQRREAGARDDGSSGGTEAHGIR